MCNRIMFIISIFLSLFLVGCQRRTAALPEVAPPAIEVAETVAIDEHTVPQDPKTQTTYGSNTGEHSPVREVSPYELRNVMPNSWHKLTGLTEAERQVFMLDNKGLRSKTRAAKMWVE